LSVYGRSKALAEALVLIALPTALVVRTSAFFGPWDPHNIVTVGLAALEAGSTFRAANDAIVSPTYVPDLVHASLDLLIDGEHGIWHLANQGCVTWFQFIRTAAAIAKVDSTRLEGCTTSALCLVAERPMNSALANGRGWVMPSLGDALERYVVERAEFDAEPEGHARRHQLTASALPLLLQALR
jgi:dTDP-4-dehydrorhamnose reductase